MGKGAASTVTRECGGDGASVDQSAGIGKSGSPKMETLKQQIESLNDIVIRKTQKKIAEAKAAGKEPGLEFKEVQARLDRGESPNVYFERSEIPVWAWSIIAAACIVQGCPNIFAFVLLFTFMYLWFDFYSGVLHVVLDHPRHIEFPFLGQPCLEFQWHHHIPRDIASKPFMQACGDLTGVMSVLMSYWFICLHDNTFGRVLISMKLFAAFLGQFNHRVSHLTRKEKPAWVKWMQDSHILLSDQDHRVHHTEPHDQNFCIGCGVMNNAFNFCLKNICSDPSLWGIWFGVVSFCDIWLLVKAAEATGLSAALGFAV